jgi:pyrophosphate--fructose-6-phosphate 1-phosphotransferase
MRQFAKTLQKGGLEPDLYGPVLFDNWQQARYLMIKKNIISKKTLKTVLVNIRSIG